MLGYVRICVGRSTPEAATRCSRSSLWWSRLLMDLKLGDGSKIDRCSRSNLRDKGGLNGHYNAENQLMLLREVKDGHVYSEILLSKPYLQ
jgi:hypothetical protein